MTVLNGNLLERVAQIIPRYSMLAPDDRVGVAVSGGADSVVLLELLHRLRERLKIQLTVLHLNHCLRGYESDADEEFVRTLATERGLPVSIQRRAAPLSGNLEQEARQMRREFYFHSMSELGLQRVALGHNQSDQAETLLYRFLRGSGTAGLSGMRAVTNDGLIRPLLWTSRGEIREWARQEGLRWREDSSNADTTLRRNLLRNETIPVLKEAINPNLDAVLANMAQVAQAEEDFWSEQIEPLFRSIVERNQFGFVFAVGRIAGMHAAMQRRFVRRALCEVRGDLRGIDAMHVDAVMNLCASEHAHDRVIVPGVDALRSFGQLLLRNVGSRFDNERNYGVELRPGKEQILPFGAGIIYLDWLEPAFQFCANFKKEKLEVFDFRGTICEGESEPRLQIRNWQPGDTICRIDHRTREKVKTLFQEEKILLWERKHWPVVVAGSNVVWVRRFGGSEEFRAVPGSGKAMRLVYRRS